MRRLVTLVDREWREIRRPTWIYAALVVVTILVTRWIAGVLAAKDGSSFFERWTPPVVIACVVFYAVLVAADSVGGETSSRRIDQLVLLPVRAGVLWTAKAIAVLGAVVLMGGWCLIVQFAALLFVDGRAHVAEFIEHGTVVLVGIAAALGVAACTLLVSTLRVRGIAAAAAGAASRSDLGPGPSRGSTSSACTTTTPSSQRLLRAPSCSWRRPWRSCTVASTSRSDVPS